MQIVAEESTIDGKSFDYSINDKMENEDIIRSIMQNYSCELCDQKDRQIKIYEEKINDYVNYIKKHSLKKAESRTEASIISS